MVIQQTLKYVLYSTYSRMSPLHRVINHSDEGKRNDVDSDTQYKYSI